jgi:oxalyl-CoA decarboxylase
MRSPLFYHSGHTEDFMETAMSAVLSPAPAAKQDSAAATTDGFHLVIDALKLNGIDTIFGLPGIPITDLTRKMQAQGMRVISFRHEQHAGNAAAAAGFLTQKPGICLTVSAPGFLNGLTALSNATVNCFPMILISGSSEREIVDLQQGDYEEMDQLAIAKPLCKAAFRVLHAQDIGIGIARAIRSAVSGRPGGVYLDLPAKLFAQTMEAAAGKASLVKVVDAAPKQIPAADAVQRALNLLKSAKRPLILLGKGAAYAQADADIRALVEKSGIPYVPMSMAKGLLPDTHAQSASAARSYVLAEADVVMLVGARLNWLLSHGKGKTWAEDRGAKQFIQIDIAPTEIDSNVAIAAPLIGDIGSCVSALLAGMGSNWSKPPSDWTGAIAERKDKNLSKMAVTLAQRPSPMNFHSALSVVRDRSDQGAARHRARQRRREHARLHALDRRYVRAAQAPRRRHLGHHGHRHGLRGGRGRRHRQAGARDRRRQCLWFLRHGGRNDLPLQPAGVRRRLQQQRRLWRHGCQPHRRAGRGADGLRQKRALRQTDGSLRRRRSACDHRRRTRQSDGRSHCLGPADADQRRHR